MTETNSEGKTMCIALAALCLLGTGGQDLIVVEQDIRELADTSVLEEMSIVHISTDWFLALGDGNTLEADFLVVDTGPVQLSDYSLVHLRTPEDSESAEAVGDVLLCRDRVALVKHGGAPSAPAAYPGVHLVQPLRVYSERALEPFRPVTLSDPDITSIVDAVDQDSLIAVIQKLEDFETRLCVTDSFYSSCEWTSEKLQSYGLTTEIEDFEFVFYGETYTSYNVVAEKTGVIEPDVTVIICGHLDSITMQNPWETAPGADDNGSGSAAVVEAARVMSDHNFRYTIKFICFGAEELGLHGSEYYASQAAAVGDSIIAVMNLDMILYGPEPYRQLFVPYNTISEDLAMNMQEISGTYVPELDLNVVYSPGTTYSDHASFWAQGYPALLGIEQGVDENPYYHQETDLLANYMEYFPFGTECARAAIATVAVYADPIPLGMEGNDAPEPLISSIGPIPAASVLNVGLSVTGHPVNLRVYDITGREVVHQTLEAGAGQATVDLNPLPPGIYGLRAASGLISSSRMIVVSR